MLRAADTDDLLHIVQLNSDIWILLFTSMHYVHIFFINGLSLSLVDVLLFLNLRAAGTQLLHRLSDLYFLRKVVCDFLLPSRMRS